MTAFSMTDCYIAINSGNVSQYVKSVTVHVEANELDSTDFADSGWTVPITGMKSGSIQLTFNQDVAASQIDSIMWPLLWSTTSFEIRPSSSGVSASNPKFTGSMLVKEWTPLTGSVGDLAEVSVTYPLSGALTRSTS